MNKIISRLILVLSLTLPGLILSGCSSTSGTEDLEAKLAEIRARPRGHIEPPPEFKPIAPFFYAAHSLRAPFSLPEGEVGEVVPDGKQVVPDFTRPKEYLERFNLEALKMVGTISKEGQSLEALVRDSSGGVNRVTAGSYMGTNFGRVDAVTETRIRLTEIVPDGHDGWVERPRVMTLVE